MYLCIKLHVSDEPQSIFWVILQQPEFRTATFFCRKATRTKLAKLFFSVQEILICLNLATQCHNSSKINAPEIFVGFMFDRGLPNFRNNIMNDINNAQKENDTLRRSHSYHAEPRKYVVAGTSDYWCRFTCSQFITDIWKKFSGVPESCFPDCQSARWFFILDS